MRLIWFFLVSGILLFSQVAAAQDDAVSVAVFSLERGADVDAEMVTTFSGIIRNEAQQVEKYRFVSRYEINFSDVLIVLDCDARQPECLRRVAEQVEARILIFGNVESEADGLRVQLQIFDAQTSRRVRSLDRTIRATDDPVIVFRKEVEAFFAEERIVALTSVQFGADVEGARVIVDDVFIGNAPMERKGLPPGTYEVRIEHPDYADYATTLVLRQGADERVVARFRDSSPATSQTQQEPSRVTTTVGTAETSPPPQSSTTNWGAYSAIGVGVVAVGGSVAFALMMKSVENSLKDEVAAGTITESRYDQLINRGKSYELTHRVLAGVGAVALVTGVVWLIMDSRDSSMALELRPDGVDFRVVW